MTLANRPAGDTVGRTAKGCAASLEKANGSPAISTHSAARSLGPAALAIADERLGSTAEPSRDLRQRGGRRHPLLRFDFVDRARSYTAAGCELLQRRAVAVDASSPDASG